MDVQFEVDGSLHPTIRMDISLKCVLVRHLNPYTCCVILVLNVSTVMNTINIYFCSYTAIGHFQLC